MPFDEDPRESIEAYPCSSCSDGNVTFNKETGHWDCDSCEFVHCEDNGTL